MSLFLQTLVLRGICSVSGSIAKNTWIWWAGGGAPSGGAENG